MSALCQACQCEPLQITEPCDNAEFPYLLCRACHKRLQARALRPVEWFNLASRFGWWQFLLHDDFYDEEGAALQPEEDVVDPATLAIPVWGAVAGDADRLFGHTLTRWGMDDALAAAWHRLPASAVLAMLRARFAAAPNPGVRDACLEIAALVLQSGGDVLVREVWQNHIDEVGVWALFQATAACLPQSEGLELAFAHLASLPAREQRDAMRGLAFFRSRKVLDWIAQHATEPVTDDWGYLAAASCMEWADVERWLVHGRPLSLIAIDALRAIAQPPTPLLRSFAPVLTGAPTKAELQHRLEAYAEKDPVPRVRMRIAALLEHSERLCQD